MASIVFKLVPKREFAFRLNLDNNVKVKLTLLSKLSKVPFSKKGTVKLLLRAETEGETSSRRRSRRRPRQFHFFTRRSRRSISIFRRRRLVADLFTMLN